MRISLEPLSCEIHRRFFYFELLLGLGESLAKLLNLHLFFHSRGKALTPGFSGFKGRDPGSQANYY